MFIFEYNIEYKWYNMSLVAVWVTFCCRIYGFERMTGVKIDSAMTVSQSR